MKRMVEWMIAKFGPVQFAIIQNRKGQWKLALVTGTLRFLPPAYSTIQQAQTAYAYISKEINHGTK